MRRPDTDVKQYLRKKQPLSDPSVKLTPAPRA